MNIDFEAGSPIYEQIINQIKRRIARGELEPGDKLLSQRDMARELEVNPNTVQRAYREMELRGLVETRRGRGTFINNSEEVVNQVKSEMVKEATKDFFKSMQSLGFSKSEIITKVKEYGQEIDNKCGGEDSE